MPFLTIVLPVYGVQGYLEECLDSIVKQPFRDIEVVAIDDCSPDHSGVILDDYAARDDRIQVVHLEQNVGLGEARNVGLQHATGEYVWFIDSDDWLAAGALQKVADRIREFDPDVLAVDYAKAWWNGRSTRSKLRNLLEMEDVPDVFHLSERPNMLKLFHVAWNKIYRRQFLIDNKITYPTGLYEDVPVGYPVLIFAERISVLPELCIFYRQRRSGAITSTVGERHFEMFTQYKLLFETLDQIGERAEIFRPIVFERMLYQGVMVLDNPERVGPESRRAFFRQLVEMYRRCRPAGGFPRPEGDWALRYSSVGWGSLAGYNTVRFYGRAKGGIRRRGVAAGRYLQKKVEAARRRVLLHYYRTQLHFRMDENLALYSMYWGRGYGCNPAPVFEKARELAPHVRGVWEVTPDRVAELPEGIEHVVIGSMKYYRTLARAKFFINNVNFPGWVEKREGSVHLSTNHGTPVKVMGVDQLKYPVGVGTTNMTWLLKRCDRWDFSISPNAFTSRIWERAYPCGYETLESGYPRNDELARATPERIAEVRAALGIQPHQQVVLYMPTHREYTTEFQGLLDDRHFVSSLGPDVVLLVRVHHFYTRAIDSSHPQIIDVSSHPRVEDLYLASDALITDYSSALFDYAVLDRPIVIYAPDWDLYRAVRGVYIDLFAERPGIVVSSQDALVRAFADGSAWGAEADALRAEFRRRYCYLDDGNASERVVRRVFLEPVLPTHLPAPDDGEAAESPDGGLVPVQQDERGPLAGVGQ